MTATRPERLDFCLLGDLQCIVEKSAALGIRDGMRLRLLVNHIA
jgi:hypothetical protein